MITLYIKTNTGTLRRCPELFPTYDAAVRFGQQFAGYGRFLVDTGSRVPSRSEQLGELSRAEQRQKLLQSL